MTDHAGPPIQIELHVPDFEVAREFYGAFGFVQSPDAVVDDEYLVLALGNQLLCFWPGNEKWKKQSYFRRFPISTKRGYGVEVVVRVSDLDAAYAVALALNCVVEPLQQKPWGMRDFRMEDPFGFYMRVTDGPYVIPGIL